MVKTAQFLFVMLMEGRNWQSYSERYGYNGIEQDDYLKENNQYLTTNPAFTRTGTGNSYTTEICELDTRKFNYFLNQ